MVARSEGHVPKYLSMLVGLEACMQPRPCDERSDPRLDCRPSRLNLWPPDGRGLRHTPACVPRVTGGRNTAVEITCVGEPSTTTIHRNIIHDVRPIQCR